MQQLPAVQEDARKDAVKQFAITEIIATFVALRL